MGDPNRVVPGGAGPAGGGRAQGPKGKKSPDHGGPRPKKKAPGRARGGPRARHQLPPAIWGMLSRGGARAKKKGQNPGPQTKPRGAGGAKKKNKGRGGEGGKRLWRLGAQKKGGQKGC